MPGKLLYIINHIDWFWSHRLPLAKGALEDGYDVTVGVTGASGDSNLTRAGFHGAELPASDEGFLPLTILKTIGAIHTMIKQHQPDVVHAITIKYAFMTGLAGLLHKNIKMTHTVAGLGYLFSGEGVKPKMLRFAIGPFMKLAFNRANTKIIFQNPDDRDIFIRRGFVRPERAFLIKGSGVDVSQFSYRPEPSNDIPVVVMPTRLVHDKGVAVFIEAARLLKSRGIQAVFQIAGGETHNNPLAISRAEMEQMVADGAALWLGRVDDMPGLLAACNLVVYPSYYREGIPKVLLEAAATGRAIITTDHPGCREAVSHGGNGLLVPVRDTKATADAIETLLNDHEKRKAMGRNSRELAENQFATDHIVRQTLAVYG